MNDNRFYVYALQDADGYAFYIGKGSGYRVDSHFWESQTHHNPHKWRKTQKLRRNGLEPDEMKRIIFDGLTEDKAYQLEKEIIEEIGLENLTNIVEGGEGGGATGSSISESEKETRISAFVRWFHSSATIREASSCFELPPSTLRSHIRPRWQDLKREAKSFDPHQFEDRIERIYEAYFQYQWYDIPAYKAAEDFDGVSGAWLKQIEKFNCLDLHSKYLAEEERKLEEQKKAEIENRYQALCEWKLGDLTVRASAKKYGFEWYIVAHSWYNDTFGLKTRILEEFPEFDEG